MSICSGVEAATVAWHPLGWKPVGFSEIEKFPCAVLAARYPDVPNFGDMTKHDDWIIDEPVDLLVGGTPCQDFSIAGLRAGLTGERGNLSLEFGRMAARLRPRWLVWENVPGVLSSNAGRDFATILGLFSGQSIEPPAGGWSNFGIIPGYRNAYGLVWRVLDAQYVRVDGFGRAVRQRRRRVFVVGYLGDWRRAAAVLFEPEGLRWDSPPRRETGEGTACGFETGPGVGRFTDVSATLDARCKDGPIRNQIGMGGCHALSGEGLGTDFDCDGKRVKKWPADVAPTLNAHFGDKQGLEDQHALNGAGLFVAHSLRGEGFDASEDGTGRGAPLVPVRAYRTAGDGCVYDEGDVTAPLTTGTDSSANIIAFSAKDYGADALENVAPTLRAGGHSGSHQNGGVMPAIAIQERAISENPNARPDGKGFRDDGAAYTIEARGVPQAVAHPYTLAIRGRSDGHNLEARQDGTSNAILTPNGGRGGIGVGAIALPWAVRRLTPLECERLQGFPDGYTDVPWRRKNWTPDGPRYKALGNSMAVNVMRWIGRRIQMVENLDKQATP